MSRIEHAFREQEDLIEALTQSIVTNLQEAIKENGKASLLVSGGSTPKPLFEKLRKVALEWEKITVGLCDERWVSSTHQDSNEAFIKTTLLQEEASQATVVGMYQEGVDAQEAEKICSKQMKASLFPFDVLVLGMGSDAHTASLFPNNERLEEAYAMNSDELCIAIEPSTAPHTRMSLTLKAILSASHLYLHFEGEEKQAVYKEAIRGEDRFTMPIRSILNQEHKDIEVYYR
ncbi:6-phosphogluconolactonase [bacterium]|nr:6-phosphogluconolactonase [bacterium]MBU1957846.1 6-phosphogluconolactonase [bacterium]